ncbi:hypothetical protein SBOR_8427 [Sclerotinia borealis F-4128]|uniref:Uncharacterized protein n=1 Tax=Sclerotinia borealis (strain F-4128) TaxID=1432307 RepID=W9C8L3_SCLBF|nr:hypothetical protein SBOR_8427 [Sclerotinia borealis F-4128]
MPPSTPKKRSKSYSDDNSNRKRAKASESASKSTSESSDDDSDTSDASHDPLKAPADFTFNGTILKSRLSRGFPAMDENGEIVTFRKQVLRGDLKSPSDSAFKCVELGKLMRKHYPVQMSCPDMSTFNERAKTVTGSSSTELTRQRSINNKKEKAKLKLRDFIKQNNAEDTQETPVPAPQKTDTPPSQKSAVPPPQKYAVPASSSTRKPSRLSQVPNVSDQISTTPERPGSTESTSDSKAPSSDFILEPNPSDYIFGTSEGDDLTPLTLSQMQVAFAQGFCAVVAVDTIRAASQKYRSERDAHGREISKLKKERQLIIAESTQLKKEQEDSVGKSGQMPSQDFAKQLKSDNQSMDKDRSLALAENEKLNAQIIQMGADNEGLTQLNKQHETEILRLTEDCEAAENQSKLLRSTIASVCGLAAEAILNAP